VQSRPGIPLSFRAINAPKAATRKWLLSNRTLAKAVWVRPELRCTVEYTEKTERGNIRGHGRFGELRP
jgi:hypothetical protein